MAIPLTRDYDAVDAGPLNASVVNNLQDAIVLHKHGRIRRNFPLHGGTRSSQWTLEALNFRFYEITADQTSEFLMQIIPLSEGARIQTISAYVRSAPIGGGTFGDGINLAADSIDVLGGSYTETQIGPAGGVDSAHDGNDEKLQIDVTGAPVTLALDEPAQIRISVDQTSADNAVGNVLRCYSFYEVDYDRP